MTSVLQRPYATAQDASGYCIISIANFDKRWALDAIRKYKRPICKSLLSAGRHLHALLGAASDYVTGTDVQIYCYTTAAIID